MAIIDQKPAIVHQYVVHSDASTASASGSAEVKNEAPTMPSEPVISSGQSLLAKFNKKQNIAAQIKYATESFAAGLGTELREGIRRIYIRDNIYLGIHVNNLGPAGSPIYAALRKLLSLYTGKTSSPMIQVVGDSSQFSVNGTLQARTFISQFLRDDYLIEYGFTGHDTWKINQTMDTNSFVTEYAKANPNQAYRIVGNVVGQTVTALETWDCTASNNVNCFVVVYNDKGMQEGFTKFGDDVLVSDFIMSAAYGDKLILVEGGAQSFKQAANALEHNIPIEALYGIGIRKPDDRKFFSTSQFFAFLTINSEGSDTANLTEARARELFEIYLADHKAWNPTRPDADTKEKLFRASAEDFFNKHLYKKITLLVTLHIRE
jgi:hypothetical protein